MDRSAPASHGNEQPQQQRELTAQGLMEEAQAIATSTGSRQPFSVKNSMSFSNRDDKQPQQHNQFVQSLKKTSFVKPNPSAMPAAAMPPISSRFASLRRPRKAGDVMEDLRPQSVRGTEQLKAAREELHAKRLENSQHQSSLQTALSPSVVTTPRKRAVPTEEVHYRNAVGAQAGVEDDQPQSPNPHKRSRSSRTGSSAAEASTSTSASISAAINEVHIRSHGANQRIANAAVVTKKERRSPKVTKTQRIDKQSRIVEIPRDSAATIEWRKRFLKAFPNLRFHIDGFDQSTKQQIQNTILQFDGQVEPFFSKDNVTHVITARKVTLPLVTNKAVAGSHTSAKGVIGGGGSNSNAHQRNQQSATDRSARLPSLRKKSTGGPLHSERNPFDEVGTSVPANDILLKAQEFGIKIWSFEKFKQVIKQLTGEATTNLKEQPNLSQLLAKEKVHGAHGKAARADYHYFSRNCVYVVVEDATQEHRPIMAQEWQKPLREDDEMPWPVLYGELEGRCPFTKFSFIGDSRKRVKPNALESLRRSVSLNHVPATQRNASVSPAPSNDSRSRYSIARGASPYPLASGNSMSIASTNITSTTSAAAQSHAGVALLSPFHQLTRKIHPAAEIGMGRPSSMPRGMAKQQPLMGKHGSLVRRMLGLEKNQRGMTPMQAVQGIAGGMRRSISTASAAQELQREAQPGFCENCKVKYDDLQSHVETRRHRKFAQDDRNFTEIDDLISRLARPIASWATEMDDELGTQEDDDDERLEGEEDSDDDIEIDDDEEFEESVSIEGEEEQEGEEEVLREVMSTEMQQMRDEAARNLQRLIDSRSANAFHIHVGNHQSLGVAAGEASLDRSMHGAEEESISSPGAQSFGLATMGGDVYGQSIDRQSGAMTMSPHTSPSISTKDDFLKDHDGEEEEENGNAEA